MDIITLIALSISIVSIVIVIVSTMTLRGRVTSQYHHDDDQSLEISAVVSEFSQRIKRLEENLVDQKVKLEILELRAQRAAMTVDNRLGRTYEGTEPVRENEVHLVPQTLGRVEGAPVRIEPKIALDKRPGSTELEALRLVFEGRGRTTAKDIQQKIGRTREHTARMMNSLFQGGLVERAVTVRPFTYSITQKGRDLMSSQS